MDKVRSVEVAVSNHRVRVNDMARVVEAALKRETGRDFFVAVEQVSDTAVRVVMAESGDANG